MAFVKTSGNAFSPTTHPSYPLGAVGAILLGIGAYLQIDERRILKTQRFSDRILYDVSFWHKVFDGMPPAFIKAVSEEGQIQHIAENEALNQFQGSVSADAAEGEETKTIRTDHRQGDEDALANGKSLYLESSDTYGINPARQIVTLKTAVKLHGREFVVGWFVPVELPETLGPDRTYSAKETGRQVTFGLVGAPDHESIRITIGDGARRAAQTRESE